MTSEQGDSALKSVFEEVASMVQSSPSGDAVADETKLKLYGLYKRCTDGLSSNSDSPAPAMWNIVAGRKRSAWMECDHLDLSEAMEEYVRLVSTFENDTGIASEKLWKTYLSQNRNKCKDEMLPMTETKDASTESNMIDASLVKPKPLIVPEPKQTFLQRMTGIKPFVSRGELDITYGDLSYAFLECMKPSLPFLEAPMRATVRLEEEIAQTWRSFTNQSEVLTGLSVRSLVDLYLSAKSYPKGSEVIIVPPIGIEGMMHVIQYHGLTLVPVDIDDYTKDPVITVNIDKVKRKINRSTVAVLVVHPFGLVCMDERDMRTLRDTIAECGMNNNIEIWEDCAECFSGKSGYTGSVHADIHFFSFGMIKTATALGGGICVLNNAVHKEAKVTSERMRRMQHTMYGQQSKKEFLVKVVKAFALQVFSKNPVLLGFALWILALFGMDYDKVVTNSVKGFPSKSNARDDKLSENEKLLMLAKNLVQRLRKRPSTALLSLLHRRLRSERNDEVISNRIERCTTMTNLIKEHLPALPLPEGSDTSRHLYWLFPFVTADPDDMCNTIKGFGYDIPRGTSQLSCVTKYMIDKEHNKNLCPNTKRMFSNILYLPISSRGMTMIEMKRMVSILKECTDGAGTEQEKVPKRTMGEKYSIPIVGLFISALLLQDAFIFKRLSIITSAATLIRIILQYVAPLVVYTLCAAFVLLQVLRMTVGPYYTKCSQAFSRYNSIFFHKPVKQELFNNDVQFSEESGISALDGTHIYRQAYDIEKHDILMLPEDKSSGEKHENKVLLTGATGFIGSLLLRELLLHRKQLNIEGGVVLICRSKRDKSAQIRVETLLSKEMFSFLNQEEKERLVTVIEGDVSCRRLGMSQKDHHRVCNDLDITHVINCSACVNFTEPLERAAGSNITSALQLQALAKSIKNRNAKYVYISTAFVHGSKSGTPNSPLPQKLFNFGKYDPLDLYKSMMDTQSCASAAMNDLGFPNTYTFTKSVCEHLLMRDEEIETIIIRPCIVGPAVQQPYEGWAGEKPSTLVSGACLYLKNPFNLWSFGKEKAAVIPVDVVCKFILAKSFNEGSNDQSASSDDESSGIISFDSSKSSEGSDHSSEQSYIFTKASGTAKQQNTKEPVEVPKNKLQKIESKIYTAAWSSSSPERATFQWYSFACAIIQLGSAKGHVEKAISYVVLLSLKVFFASGSFTLESFQKYHALLVHWPLDCLKKSCSLLGLNPRFLRKLNKLMPFLDLPILFFPFTSATFHFESDLKAPIEFNSERYMFSCILAAEEFVVSYDNKKNMKSAETFSTQRHGCMAIAGKESKKPFSDLVWCMMQPNGNYAIRLVGWVVIKLLRSITNEVTIDVASFTAIMRAVEESETFSKQDDSEAKTFVVLAPTHRSFLDFILLSFISFSLPELGVSIPDIAAADDFSRIPVLGFLAQKAGAFFLRRGRGTADPALDAKVRSIKEADCKDKGRCIEVFLEGKRSRDRRFIKPKTGFLRCLVNTRGNHVIVPITINYEGLPEQSGLAKELNGDSGCRLSLVRLFHWFKAVLSNQVNLGRIHVSAATPLLMKDTISIDVKKVATAVQKLQRSRIVVSKFHIEAFASVIDATVDTIRDSLKELSCPLWSFDDNNDISSAPVPTLPDSTTEKWSIFLHFGHFYAPFLNDTHPLWSQWLMGFCSDVPAPLFQLNDNTINVVEKLKEIFDSAENAVDETIDLLQTKTFINPSPDHILQYVRHSGSRLPSLLLQAAISMKLENSSTRESPLHKATSAPVEALFEEGKTDDGDAVSSSESFGAWGYKDSGFVVSVNSNGHKTVVMKGDRYAISGKPMPKLIPFLEQETNLEVDPVHVTLPKRGSITIPCSDLTQDSFQKILNVIGNDEKRLSISDTNRARHGTGHSQEDMYLIRSDTLSTIRLPDAIVYPEEEAEVEALTTLAIKEGWCLIPFGGGTNVCHATWCPPKEKDPRPMVSVDMKRMNKILSVNEEDSTIDVQAGITGGDLVREMHSLGYTIGHEPDSIEFSTLGGWIATKASGMKQNRYGNIESIVKQVRVVSTHGILWQHSDNGGASFARISTGIDLTDLMVGSEGCLGIVTSATVRIWPLPEVKEYDSIILHKFDDGLRFMKDVSKLGALKPASVRLLDNTQFRLGQALKSQQNVWSRMKQQCKKAMVGLFVDIFKPTDMVCVTITYEGSEAEVNLQKQQIRGLVSNHGGLCTGSEIGKAGYDMTYAIAYIRDFAMTYGFLAESFETFVPWSKVKSLIIATKVCLKKEHEKRALPGNPIITCRVTQLYDEGVCVYFYFCMNFENVSKPSAVFADIETVAREAILAHGGSLSHHHGIGKHRAPLMKKVNSDNLKKVFMQLKDAVDPSNTFGARNGSFA